MPGYANPHRLRMAAGRKRQERRNNMSKHAKKLTWRLCAALTIMALAAAAFDFIDASWEPPAVVSLSGQVTACRRIDGGLLLSVVGGDDAVVVVSGGGDSPLGYRILAADGKILAEGEGAFVPLADWPDAAGVFVFALDGSPIEPADDAPEGEQPDHVVPQPLMAYAAAAAGTGYVHGDAKTAMAANESAAVSADPVPGIARGAMSGLRSGEQSGLGGTFTVAVSISSAEPGFLLFGLSEPGGTTTMDCLPQFSFSAATYSNVCEVTASGGWFIPPETGTYAFQVAGDDHVALKVGETIATADWPSNPTGAVVYGDFVAGVRYLVSMSASSIGGPAAATVLKFAELVPPPAYKVSLSVDRKNGQFSLKAPTGSQATVATTGEKDPAVQYVIRCIRCDAGITVAGSESEMTAVPDAESFVWQNGCSTASATFALFEDGVQTDTEEVVFTILPEKEKKCGCNCSEGTTTANESVEFSQRFGRTPWVAGLPVGSLAIRETSPVARLWTPSALVYDHPMCRHVESRKDANPLNVVITDAFGDGTEYRDGRPVGMSAGLSGGIQYNSDGLLVEVLEDRMEITYNPDGTVMSLKPADGEEVPVEDLGIDIIRDSSGAISSVVSVADGRMDVDEPTNGSYRVTWRNKSGDVAKTFTFSGDGETTFHLHEYRGEQFQFDSEWVYDDSVRDWIFTKAPGTNAAKTWAKAISYDATNQAWNVLRTTLDATGGVVRAESSILDISDKLIMETSRVVGGHSLYSAERNDTGTVASDVNGTGLATAYLYDDWNRVTNETATVKGGILRSTSFAYTNDWASGGIVDRRPRRRTVTEDGVVVEDEETVYASNRVTRIRRFGDAERVSFREMDSQGRTTLSVDEAGRAVRTEYAPFDTLEFSWAETRDEGIWSEDGGFAVVAGKSTRTVTSFDAAGNAVLVRDYAFVGGEWHETEWTTNIYNAAHKIVSAVRSNGKSSSSDWICTGPVWTLGEDGIATTNAYDEAKALVSSVRYGSHGAVTTAYEYDADGRIACETDTADGCEARTRLRSYDEEGRIVSETDGHGLSTTYSYSPDGRVTTVTLPSGGTRVTTINPDGSLASVTGTAATPEFHTYGVTTNGLTWTKVTYLDPDGARWVKTYRNGFGETVREERPGANGSILVTDYTYNAKGQLILTTATGEPSETRMYDQWGDAVSLVRSSDGAFRVTQGVSANEVVDGEVWSVTAKAEYCSDFAIAPLVTTNMVQLSGLSLSNESRRISFDVRGNATETWTEFDPATSTRLTSERIPAATNIALSEEVDGVATLSVSHSAVTNSAAYDAYRRTVSRTDGRGNTTASAYDSLGRLASVTDATGATTSYAYDSAGRIAAVTNALGVATVYEYDVRGNKTYEGGGTYPVTCAYDAFNVMTNMTTYRNAGGTQFIASDAIGDTTTWLYDEATGLLLSRTYADGRGPTYTYTDSGNLATRTWARGIVTAYSYDGWNNLTNTAYSDATPSISLAYDAMGRQTNAVDAAGSTATAYDAYGDVASESVSGLYSRSLSHVRDAYGRDLGYTLNNSRMSIVEYEADTARMKRVKMAGVWFTWSYLAGTDLRSRLAYGTAGYTDYSYEPHRDLLTEVRNHIYDDDISVYGYTNDAIGRRTAISRSGTMMSETRTDYYGYNDRNELILATKNTEGTEYQYSYDDIGNRMISLDLGTNRTYAANSLNQYTNIVEGVDDFSPQYDLDGNQTLVRTTTGDWSVTYNGENRPVLWECGSTNIVMKFDRMGRRVEYVETVSVVTNTHHRFVYDGYLCVQRLNGVANNSIDLVFTWDPSEPVATRPLVLQKYGQYNLFYTHDGNKNVSELVFFQQANGIAAHYEYAPFGTVTTTSSSTPVTAYDFREYNPFRFSAEIYDKTLDLVHYNYRQYNPLFGRWQCRDMLDIELHAQPNSQNTTLYGFVQNNPIDFQDCLGLVKIEHKYPGALTPGASNCLGGAMTGQENQYRYPNNDSLQKTSFKTAMSLEGWICTEVKSVDECKNKECHDKILIALYLNRDENNVGKNPWTDPSFNWDYQGVRTDSIGRKKTDLHSIRYDSENGRYKQIPHASYEPQSFDNNIDDNLFIDVPLLCCHKKIEKYK